MLSDRWILTGASCTRENGTLTVTAHSAVVNIESDTPSAKFGIVHEEMHPRFTTTPGALYNMALLKTDAPIPFAGGLKPICLPKPRQSAVPTGQIILAAGWGAPTLFDEPDRLKWGRMTTTNATECKQTYDLFNKKQANDFLEEDLFCTKFEKTESFECALNNGDAGVALMAQTTEGDVKRWQVVGLNVAGAPCGTSSHPDINVAVGLEWISSVIAKQ